MSSPSISDRVPHHFAPNDRRCSWVRSDPLMVAYHDTEWGAPVHDDQKLFEFMVLDAMQAGVNFRNDLPKASGVREAPYGFFSFKKGKDGERRCGLTADAQVIVMKPHVPCP